MTGPTPGSDVRIRRNGQTLLAVIGLLAVIASGCGASVGKARGHTAPVPAPTTSSRPSDDVRVERLLVRYFEDGNLEGTGIAATCMAREVVRREGGAEGLAKLGIATSSTTTEVGDAMDQMLQERVLDNATEPFDRFVDAMFACDTAKKMRAEFLAGLERDGNSSTASECLADRVVGNRYLRLVLVVGTRPGATEDPRVKVRFRDPLLAAIDRAALACDVVSWGVNW